MLDRTRYHGFTLVELLIVIIVLSILAAVTIVGYSGVRERSKTSAGYGLATQVSEKAKSFYSVQHTYPTAGQLKANPPLVPEARLSDNDDVLTGVSITNQRLEATYKDGAKIVYRQNNGQSACVVYWDYQAKTYQIILLGSAHSACT